MHTPSTHLSSSDSKLPEKQFSSHEANGVGALHVVDEEIDLSKTPIEAWIANLIFCILGVTVFYQFFTRYALNDSAAWTEEIARYLLIATVFIGATIGVIKNNHIKVDFFYRFLPVEIANFLAKTTNLLQCVFFAAMFGLTIQLMIRLADFKMTIIDLPLNLVYGFCLFGFGAMFCRAAQSTIFNWRKTL